MNSATQSEMGSNELSARSEDEGATSQRENVRLLEQLEKARANLQQVERILDSLPVLISYIDSAEYYQFNNAAYERWFGISRDSLRGRHIRDVLGPEAYAAITPHVQATLAGQRRSYESIVHYRFAGSHYVSVDYIPDISDSGTVRGFCALVVDVTARRDTERALRQSEERFRRLARTANVISWEADPVSWRFTAVSARAYECLGYPATHWLTEKFWTDHLHPDDRAAAIAFCQENMEKEDNYEFEYRMLAADGRTVWFHDLVHVVREHGQPIKLQGFLVDITERKMAEEMRARLAAIIESSQDAIYGGTLDGTITSWNTGAQLLFGYSADEVIGRPISILYPSDRIEEGHCLLDRLNKGERIPPFRTTRLCKDGRIVCVSLAVSPIRSPDGRMAGISAIARDVSDRLALEGEVLRASEVEKQRIAQDLHDGLGQHLTGTEFLCAKLEMDLDQKGGPEVETARQITGLVNEAIRQTRLLAKGLLPVEFGPEGLADALRKLCSQLETLYPIRCVFRYPKPIRIRNAEAATHFYRIAQEACGNALRHGRATKIEVALIHTAERIVLTIKDNGLGLPVDLPEDRGIGLRTMRYRADLMNASLSFASQPGHGTIVTCSIPGQLVQ